MAHQIHTVTGFEKVAPFTLRVRFEDGSSQVIDFRPVLHGEIFSPLLDSVFFDRVQLDDESGTLTWPNGADFEPAMLHDWPRFGPQLAALAGTWREARQTTKR
ncbi:MAG: DUF2442 domain-containing protein [Acidobacteriota bacterium]